MRILFLAALAAACADPEDIDDKGDVDTDVVDTDPGETDSLDTDETDLPVEIPEAIVEKDPSLYGRNYVVPVPFYLLLISPPPGASKARWGEVSIDLWPFQWHDPGEKIEWVTCGGTGPGMPTNWEIGQLGHQTQVTVETFSENGVECRQDPTGRVGSVRFVFEPEEMIIVPTTYQIVLHGANRYDAIDFCMYGGCVGMLIQ